MCCGNKEEQDKKLDYIIQRINEIDKFLQGKSIKHNPDLMNVHAASKYTQLSISTVYNYVSLKRIPHIKQGHKVLFSKRALDKWLPKREDIDQKK